MDDRRFDNLARGLAAGSRRDLLRAAAGAALAAVIPGRAAAARCRQAGEVCAATGHCCSNICGAKDATGRRRCSCPAGREACQGTCVAPATDYASDANNCGACGRRCPSTRCQTGVCANGVCGLAPNPARVGKTCDDGNACTLNDVCRADGSCAGTPVVCATTDQCHAAGVCNPSTGVCTNPIKPDGSPCDDGNPCTQNDTCRAGVCRPGTAVTCTASDQCHAAGTCDPQTGVCSNPAKADGTACDDGNACTIGDTCQAGVCTAGASKVCTASDQCHVAGTCDPATGTCSDPAAQDGTGCDDGNACTRNDTCRAGACTPGTPVTCTASDQCHTAGTCDPTTGVCSDPPKANGTSCSDANACTQTDTCQNGVCTNGSPVTCAALDQCHDAGTCNPATGVCSNPAKANGTSCAVPNGIGTCQAGVCTVAACNSGFANCNGSATDGCETNTNASASHCGGCNNVCVAPNGTAICAGGVCAVGRCNAGFGNCNGVSSDGCETNLLTSLRNCGSCGNDCTANAPANSTGMCQGGQCVYTCDAGTFNQNGYCCPNGSTTCSGGGGPMNSGCCDQACCGNVCCNFTGACCKNGVCGTGSSFCG